jgi:hypothetical protein
VIYLSGCEFLEDRVDLVTWQTLIRTDCTSYEEVGENYPLT